jgi:ribose transport system ATP-binding protein
MSEHRLRVENIKVKFGGTVALDGVDFWVKPGEIVALIGENGAGKSTLMKVLSGAILPNEGNMHLDGKAFAPKNPEEARHSGIAMIYQELSLPPALTVQDNIFLGMEISKGWFLDRGSMRAAAQNALNELGRELDLDMPVRNLSISDRQVVEIARARAVGCKVLILDEPTSSITQQDVQRLFTLMRSLKEQGHSIIYISHFLEEIEDIADRFVVLRDGKTVGSGKMGEVSREEIVALMVGRTLSDLYPRSTRDFKEPLLEVSSLAGDNKLQSATLQVRRGEVLGIFGLVGSGRTDLIRTLFGLDRVKSGEITVGSYSGLATPAQRWSQGIGMVSEDRKAEGLATARTVAENLVLSYPQSCERLGVFSPTKMSATTADWISKLSIKCRTPEQKIGDLSGGNQQKIALARLLHHDVDLLLLDEPTRGIDVGSKKQIYERIDSLACSGKAVVIVSSYLPELLGTCDRIAVMNRGRLSQAKNIKDLTEHSIMMEAIS